MNILLIVDVQNDFCPGGALAVEKGDQIVPLINKLMERGSYDLIIASQDWHPQGHSSFSNPWPVHCVQGSFGAEFHPDLKTKLFDKIVQKGTDPAVDSYSAFFDNDHKKQTGLLDYLDGITDRSAKLTVCGLATDYCVRDTAIDAATLGYEVELVLDACRAVNLERGDDVKALRGMLEAGVALVECREILGNAPLEREQGLPSDQNRGVVI